VVFLEYVSVTTRRTIEVVSTGLALRVPVVGLLYGSFIVFARLSER